MHTIFLEFGDANNNREPSNKREAADKREKNPRSDPVNSGLLLLDRGVEAKMRKKI